MTLAKHAAIALLSASVMCGAWLESALAQTYPDKPVRLLVGYAAGGASDTAARVLAPRLSEKLAQQFVVDNRPGAGTVVATSALAQARADGHTLMMTNSAFGANPALHSKLAYDALKDFVSVGLLATVPNVLIVIASLPVKSPGDLIALVRSRPGYINHAHSGAGSSGYLASEVFKYDARINFVQIPYQGGPQTLGALMGGEAHMAFLSVSTSLPLVQSGKVRALAVTSIKRNAAMPDVPTVAETVVPGFEVNDWHGVIAPAGTPKEIVLTLNREMNRALALPDVKARLATIGAEPAGGTPEKMGALVRAEIGRWKSILKPVD
jgi:tripartite-type tricarboxylate transporter receptor subunit TctC